MKNHVSGVLGAPQQPPQQRTLGPISDLERHLPTDWWRTLFNALYLKTDGDVVENERNTQADVDALVELCHLKDGESVLDLCCGQGRHSLELARRGFRGVTGLDRSRYLVRLARKRADRLKLPVSFREGDARKFRFRDKQFDCVALFGNSFGYFEREEDDLAVLQAAFRVTKSGARIFLDVVDGDWMRANFTPRSWEWIDQNHFVCRERALAEDQVRLISREVITHAERGVIVDQFYAERLYRFEDLKKLLIKAGFVNVSQHEANLTNSERNQDLGMMSHRLIVVAHVPDKPRPVLKKGPIFPHITVLMGDPSLPDIVKLEGQFNAEDLNTIHKMEEALGSLGDYQFRIWNRHGDWLDTLRSDKPSFVLNLCDEGYMNDAFKELHVPAVLEMLDIPYSGAGPACLGLCYNKSHVRALAHSMDIPVPLETYFSPDDQAATLPSVFPVLLKPNQGDSSQGITKNAVVHSHEELDAYLEFLRSEFPKRPILVQEFLSGAEYSVGVVGNPGMNVFTLPILEVDYSGLDASLPKLLGYESKWDPTSPYWTQISYHEARLIEEQQRQLVDYSLMLFERLDCRDYARFDFRADANGQIKLLEVNPNPGWCWDGKLNFMAGYAGLSYTDLLRLIIEAAQDRYRK